MAELTQIPYNPEANTQILQSESDVMGNYYKAQELQFRKKQADYQQKKAEADQLVDVMDFDKAGIRRRDLQDITDYAHENMYQFAYDNPKALNPTFDDKDSIAQASKFRENVSQAHYLANKSKLLKAQHDKLKTAAINSGDTELIKAIDDWYDHPLEEMKDFDYTPTPDFNMTAITQELTKSAPVETVLGKTTDVGAGHVNIPEIKQYTPEAITQMNDKFERMWSDDYTAHGKEGIRSNTTKLWNGLSDAEKAQYPTPKEYARHLAVPQQQISVVPKVVPRSYAPQGNGNDETKPEFNWIVDNAVALSNPDSPIYSDGVADKSGKQVGKLTHVFDGLVIPVGGKNDKNEPIQGTIRAIYNIGGKIYAKTGTKEAGTGFTSTKDLVEITNRYGQLVTKYINQEYGSSPTTAKAIQAATNYAREVDQNNELGLPAGTSTTTKEKTYSLNGKPYTISDITAAAKASGMTVDEYIKAAGLK